MLNNETYRVSRFIRFSVDTGPNFKEENDYDHDVFQLHTLVALSFAMI